MGSCSSNMIKVDEKSTIKHSKTTEQDDAIMEAHEEDIDSKCVKELFKRLYHGSKDDLSTKELDMRNPYHVAKLQMIDDILDDANELMDPFKHALNKIFENKHYGLASEEGIFPTETEELIDKAYDMHLLGATYSREKVALYYRALSRIFIESKALAVICDVYIYYVANSCEDFINTTLKWYTTMRQASGILWNLTDISDEMVDYIATSTKMLEVLKQALKDSDGKDDMPYKHKYILQTLINLSHNIAMREVHAGRFRQLDFMTVVAPYLHSSDNKLKLLSLAILANIIDETESEIINANLESVEYLLKCMKKGTETDERGYNGLSCQECVLIVRKLCRNDNNKKMLNQLGTLKYVVDVAVSGLEEEIFECISAIWALAFDQDIRRQMVNEEDLGVIKLLQDVRNKYPSRRFQKVCNGIFWTIREELKLSKNETYRQIGQSQDVVESKERLRKSEGHVMISYQRDSRQILKRVRDEMKRKGLKVWMDIDDMQGSTIEAMAQAVEDASIVLMAMSRSYKNSENCRLEAKYAHTRKKTIVPLLMERDYKPDGWLGILLGDGLFYDFSGKYDFDDKMRDLLKRISKLLNENIEDEPKYTAVPEKSEEPLDSTDGLETGRGLESVQTAPKPHIQGIIRWTSSDLQRWIQQYELTTPRLSQLTPEEIGLLVTMRHEAPESFYKCVREMLGVDDFRVMARLVTALSSVM